MAVITTTFGTASVTKIIRDLDSDLTVETNINSGAAVIQQININNSTNSSTSFYLHLWNQTSAPTFGTTKPTMVIFCPANTSKNYVFIGGINFATGLCMAGSTTSGPVATWSPAAPTNAVAVSIYID